MGDDKSEYDLKPKRTGVSKLNNYNNSVITFFPALAVTPSIIPTKVFI